MISCLQWDLSKIFSFQNNTHYHIQLVTWKIHNTQYPFCTILHHVTLTPCPHPLTFILAHVVFFFFQMQVIQHPTTHPVTSYRKSFKPQITHVTPLLISIYSKTQVTQHTMFTSSCLTIIPRMSIFTVMILTYLLSTLTCSLSLFPCMDIQQRTALWCLMKTISL